MGVLNNEELGSMKIISSSDLPPACSHPEVSPESSTPQEYPRRTTDARDWKARRGMGRNGQAQFKS